jgi:hypothetical protein
MKKSIFERLGGKKGAALSSKAKAKSASKPLQKLDEESLQRRFTHF